MNSAKEPEQVSEQVGNGQTEDESNNILDNLNKDIKNKMDSKIYESFQKPHFVKTGEILIKRKSEESSTNNVKKPKLDNETILKGNLKHKFKFHDE